MNNSFSLQKINEILDCYEVSSNDHRSQVANFISAQNKKNKYVVIKSTKKNKKSKQMRYNKLLITNRTTIYEDELSSDYIFDLINKLIALKKKFSFMFSNSLTLMVKELYSINSEFSLTLNITAQGNLDTSLVSYEAFVAVSQNPTELAIRCPIYTLTYDNIDFLNVVDHPLENSILDRLSSFLYFNHARKSILPLSLNLTYAELLTFPYRYIDYFIKIIDLNGAENNYPFKQMFAQITSYLILFLSEFKNPPLKIHRRKPLLGCMKQPLRAQAAVDTTCNSHEFFPLKSSLDSDGCSPSKRCRTRTLQTQAWYDNFVPNLTLGVNEETKNLINNIGESMSSSTMKHEVSEDTTEKLSNILNIFKDVVDNGSNKVSTSAFNLKHIMNRLISVITGGIEIKIPQLDNLFLLFENLAGFAKKTLIVICAFYICKMLYQCDIINCKSKYIINTIVALFGTVYILDQDLIREIVDCFYQVIFTENKKEKKKNNNDLTAQADVSSVDASVDAFLVLIQSISLGRSFYYKEDLISGFKKSIHGWSRVKGDVVSSIDTWMNLIQKFITYIGTNFFDNPCILWEGKYPALKLYVEAAQVFLNQRVHSPILTYEIGRDLERVQTLGREAINQLPISASNERTVHRAVTDSLKIWVDKLMKANFLGNGPRIKPLGVLFSGPSQIGKSEFNSVFVRSVMARILPKSKLESYVMNPTSEIYNRIVEQDFWDGWRDQSAVTIDELGARRDAVGQNSEAFESIRLINGSNYNLHAAHLDEKGVLNARPMLVAATSNEIGFTFDGLRFMKAFENRYTAFAVLPKAEYLASDPLQRYDYNNCKMKKLDTWLEEFEHLEFVEYDLTLAREKGNLESAIVPGGKVLNAVEMIDWAVEEISKLQTKGEMILRQHNKIIYKQARLRNDWKEVKNSFKGADFEDFKKLYEKIDKEPCLKQGMHAQSSFSFITQLPFFLFICTYLNNLKINKDINVNNAYNLYKDYTEYVAQGGDLDVESFQTLSNLYKEDKNYNLRISPTKDIPITPFNCGDCVVCKANVISVEDLISVSRSDLWPGRSFDMTRHVVRSVIAGETQRPYGAPTPPCLKLEKDIYINAKLIKFGSEEYADNIYMYFVDCQSKVAQTQSGALKNFILDSFDCGKGIVRRAIKNYKIIIPAMTAVVTFACALNHVMKKFFPESRSNMSSKRRSKVATARRQHRPEAQSFCDGKIASIMSSVVNKNQFRIYAQGQSIHMGFVTMISGHVGFMPRHFVEILQNFEDEAPEKSTSVRFVRALQVDKEIYHEIPYNKFTFYDNNALGNDDEDILFFQIPERLLSRSKDIRNFFISKKDAPQNNFRGALWKPDVSTKIARLTTYDSPVTPNQDNAYFSSIFNWSDETPYRATSAYRYDAPTVVGDCGSLLTRILSVGSNARILGMHVAGSAQGYAVAIPVYKELVDDAFNYFYPDSKIVFDEELEIPNFYDATLKAESNCLKGFTFLGKMKGPRAPTKTKIVRSPLYEKIAPCKMEPVKLYKHTTKEGERINPTEVARSIYSHPVKYIDDNILEPCVFDTIKSIFLGSRKTSSNGFGVGPRKLTLEEAIWGVDGHDFLCGLKSSSSPGFPYCLENPLPGTKKFWVGSEGKPEVLGKPQISLIKDVEEILNKVAIGVRPEIIFTDFLKDETRKIGKGARPISGANQAYLAACNVEFGAVTEFLLNNRIDNGFTIGVNAYSEEWSYLAEFLHMKGTTKSWIDGDFKNFDASHTRQLLMSFKDFCDEFYLNRSISRDTLLEDLANSVHISEDKVYQWDCSLPSGHPLTSIINCWINLVINRVAFVITYIRKWNGESKSKLIREALELYNKEVKSVVYGDDNVHYVGQDAQVYLNIQDHATSMLQIGYIYTDANKRTDTKEFKNWREISFLKRKFRKHEVVGRIVAPLDMDSMMDSLQWIKSSDVDLNDYRSKITTVISELSFHERSIFDKYFKEIVSAARVVDYVSPLNKYSAFALSNAGRQEYL